MSINRNERPEPFRERENRDQSDKMREAFEKAPTSDKIRFIRFLLSKEKDAEERKKLLLAMDEYAERGYLQTKAEKPEGAKLPDGKTAKVENGEIVIGSPEKRETVLSDRLRDRVLDDAKSLKRFDKIEPFAKSLIREGVPLTEREFEEIARAVFLILREISEELDPALPQNRTNRDRKAGRVVIDPYDPNADEPSVINARKSVSELNAKFFADRPSVFRMRP